MEFLKFHTATTTGEPETPAVVHPRTPLNLGKFFDKIISIGTTVLPFLIPIYFLATTSEFYELNKQFLLIIATSILTVAWFGKMWAQRELRFIRTPLEVPILLFLLVYIITTATSVNLTASILGHFGRFDAGLVSVICYVFLYFIYVNNVRTLDQVKKIAAAVSLSGIVLAALGVLSYFDLFRALPWDLLHNRFFTPAGSPNILVYFLMATLPITLSLLSIARGGLSRALYAVGAVLSFGEIALASGSFSQSNVILGAWVGVAVALVIFFYFAREVAFSRNRGLFTTLVVIFLALSTLAIPLVRDRLPSTFQDLPREVNLDWSSSWPIAASTLGERPFQGSGPDTFLFDFTRFRNFSMNATPYWNLRFDRAASEFLQILTTLGLLGLAAFIYFVYRIVRLATSYLPKEKELETHTISVGFAAGTLALLLVSLAFSYLSTATAFLLWLSLAMLMRLWVEEKQVVVKSTVVAVPMAGEAGEGRRDIFPAVVFFPALLIGILVIYLFSRMLWADITFEKSLDAARANNGRDTYSLQRDALQTAQVNLGAWTVRFDRDIYYRTFSGTNLLLANSLAGQTKPDTNLVNQFVQQAISSAQAAKDFNPWDVNNWEQLATIYRNIVSYATGSDQYAEQSYAAAINLDPTNARLYDALGTFYSQVTRYDDAIRVLGQATALKPDLAAAHFDRARALVKRAAVDGTTKEKQRDYLTAAVQEYQATLNLVTKGSADETQVKNELATTSAQLDKLGGPTPTTSTSTVSPTASPSGTRK